MVFGGRDFSCVDIYHLCILDLVDKGTALYGRLKKYWCSVLVQRSDQEAIREF